MTSGATAWFAAHAWLATAAGPRLTEGVRLAVDDGVFLEVVGGRRPAAGDRLLPGVVLPGLANTHSHAFHRALRGRTHGDGGTFWTWRERMYAVAAALTPENYLALARATYAELALSGSVVVGEFHYVHHDPSGTPYADPNAMGLALAQAAAEAGIRLTLLDTCYLAGGLTESGHTPIGAQQARFADADVDTWFDRMAARSTTITGPGVRFGAAIHSVRAVPDADLARIGKRLRAAPFDTMPVHAHVAEQPAEVVACRAFYGRSPVGQLDAHGLIDRRFTAVHATHPEPGDIRLLGSAGATVAACPTTERDLADGIGPMWALNAAGAAISIGSDQHAVIDPFEELRGVEAHERLASGQRGRFGPDDLVTIATEAGHRCLGWSDAGFLAPGARADLVAVRTDSLRTAGAEPGQVHYAATAADVDTVVVDGQVVVSAGRHTRIPQVGAALSAAIDRVTAEAPGQRSHR